MTGYDLYKNYIGCESDGSDHPEFIADWKTACAETDGCSSGWLKKISGGVLRFFKSSRKYIVL